MGLGCAAIAWYTNECRQIAAARTAIGPRILDRGEQPEWRRRWFGDDPVRYAKTIDGWALHDEDLAHLKRCVQLRRLYLNATPITDAGVRHLQGLRTLISLELNDTEVTDDGLWTLRTLSNLERIDVSEPRTTPAGRARLRTYWPQAEIVVHEE
jgi:hypothetical protein